MSQHVENDPAYDPQAFPLGQSASVVHGAKVHPDKVPQTLPGPEYSCVDPPSTKHNPEPHDPHDAPSVDPQAGDDTSRQPQPEPPRVQAWPAGQTPPDPPEQLALAEMEEQNKPTSKNPSYLNA